LTGIPEGRRTEYPDAFLPELQTAILSDDQFQDENFLVDL
jgi:hypothetical protein